MIEAQQRLKQIQRDMLVYDNAGEKIGKVSFVHIGIDEFVADWSIALDDPEATAIASSGVLDELPNGCSKEVIERLLQLGFIKIKGGLFTCTRYVLPEHIALVHSDQVQLNVEKGALPTF